MIRAIDRREVKSLAAAQVIVDIASATKELLENSLDADASQISNNE